MSNRIIALCVVLFLFCVAGLFIFTYLAKHNTGSEPVVPTVATTTQTTYGITRIDGKHFFKNGVHTIVGSLPLPTPCDLLTTESLVAESYPEQVTFMFAVVNTTDTCAQMITTQRFKVSATASKEANLRATFSGIPVELNLIEAEVGETPEEFELFIKG